MRRTQGLSRNSEAEVEAGLKTWERRAEAAGDRIGHRPRACGQGRGESVTGGVRRYPHAPDLTGVQLSELFAS